MSQPRRLWVAVGFCAFILGATWGVRPQSTETVPPDLLQVSTGWADESSCIQCHEQAQEFSRTGHARTLRLASDPSVRELLAQLPENPAAKGEGTALIHSGTTCTAVNAREGFQSTAPIEWCFGSGQHARTWVGVLTDSHGASDLLEFRWSWFRNIDGFDLTPGHAEQPLPGYYAHLGLLFDQPKARRCFGCHATMLPVDAGRIDAENIHMGVTCQRCHGPRAEHVASEGRSPSPWAIPTDRNEAVKRCAECHRSPEEQPADTIRPGNPDIVRFQPIGLSRSACFQQSEMTCVTCHDPHRPLESQDSTGIWQCVQCHDGTKNDRPLCRASHTDRCITCHMPRVAMDSPIQFTDHWIRVRDEEESR